ncbi:hypothetical protein JOE37_001373 [Clavibacter michiganensis]|nr:hypothetical protein [Clavibacter michiganensis]
MTFPAVTMRPQFPKRPPPVPGLQRVFTSIWVLLAVFAPVYRLLGPAGGAWTYAALGLIALIVILGRGARPKWPALWIFGGYAALAAGISSSGESGLVATLPVALQLAVLVGMGPFALRGCVVRDPSFLVKVSITFLAAQTVSALAGLLQLVGQPVLGIPSLFGRSPGLAGHPNILGVMAGAAIVLCAHHLSRARGHRTAVLIALVINVGGLLSSGSISSLIATALGAVFVLSANKVPMKRIIWALLIGATSLILLIQIPAVAQYFRSPADRILQVTGQTDQISTLSIRLQTYAAVFDRILYDPFMGKGLDYESAASYGTTVVHNIVLRGWYQGGLMLAIAIAAIIVAAALVATRNVRFREHGASTGILVVLLSYALTAAFFEQAYYWLPVLVAWVAMPPSVHDAAFPHQQGDRVKSPA